MSVKVIETTYEFSTDAYIYRLTRCSDYAYIKRTPVENPLWSHSIITEMYCVTAGKFVSTLFVKNHKVPLERAIAIAVDCGQAIPWAQSQ